MTEKDGARDAKNTDFQHPSRVFGGGGREMMDPPTRIYRPGRIIGARLGAPESAKPVYILLTVAAIILGLVALGLNL